MLAWRQDRHSKWGGKREGRGTRGIGGIECVEPICVGIPDLRVTRKIHPAHPAQMGEIEAGQVQRAPEMLIQLTGWFWPNPSLFVVVQYALCVVLHIAKQ
jgi:hypothetical protein